MEWTYRERVLFKTIRGDEMKYQITKIACQKMIDKMGNRVCCRCGRPIVPISTVDNSGHPTFWSGCFHGQKGWGHFDNGVSKETYKLAYKLVLNDGLYFTSTKDGESDFDYWFQYNTSKLCGMLDVIEYMKNNEPRYTKNQLKKQFKEYPNVK